MRRGITVWVIRLFIIFLFILLAFFLYHYGKEHKIYVDNRTVEVDGKSYRALSYATYKIDGGKETESTPRTRDEVTVKRQNHTLTLTWENSDYEEESRVMEFVIPVNKYQTVLSLPLVAAGFESEDTLSDFVSMAELMGIRSTTQEVDTVDDEQDLFGEFSLDF